MKKYQNDVATDSDVCCDFFSGEASKQRPWMNNYPDEMRDMKVPDCSLFEFLKDHIRDEQSAIIHYYGCDYNFKEIKKKVDDTAMAMCAIGIKQGDKIPVFLQAVPEFLLLLLAAEKIGAAIVCRDDTPQNCADAIKKTGSKFLFTHDFLSKEDEKLYFETTNLEKIITISPYHMADKESMSDHIIKSIEERYPEQKADNQANLTWEEFLLNGEKTEIPSIKEDHRVPLFCAYTSGSTGDPKQVIHSAQSMIGVLFQMTPFAPAMKQRMTWLHTILPPALVAVVVSMILNPLATNKLLILDPFCKVEDLDLEMMRYQPNCWASIPLFMEFLLHSKRIPQDYSMKHLYAVGAGAEALNNRQIRRIHAFLKKHQCHAFFSTGYGQSEAGSSCTMPCPGESIEDCCYGIPMPATIISVFDKDGETELPYGKIGEICRTGPGTMIGYDGLEATQEVLKVHRDGKVWLHTGDYGYITEKGLLHILGRGLKERAGGGYLFELVMENRVCDVQGIEDIFFVVVPDQKNPGYYLPYAYVQPEDGADLEEIKEKICIRLEPHEIPCEITAIKHRPYFHFKTNRKGLTAEILKKGQKIIKKEPIINKGNDTVNINTSNIKEDL